LEDKNGLGWPLFVVQCFVVDFLQVLSLNLPKFHAEWRRFVYSSRLDLIGVFDLENGTMVHPSGTAVPFSELRLKVRIGPDMDDLIYSRVSTAEQSDSLPVQEKKSKDFAKAQNLNVTHVFTDAESARTTGRPQL
jgi:Resolvase, N terminal domain